jgi:hypothetical protein
VTGGGRPLRRSNLRVRSRVTLGFFGPSGRREDDLTVVVRARRT